MVWVIGLGCERHTYSAASAAERVPANLLSPSKECGHARV